MSNFYVTFEIKDRTGNKKLRESFFYHSRPLADELDTKRSVMKRRFYDVYHAQASEVSIQVTPNMPEPDDDMHLVS